jgi:serine/threonine-protein kinase
MEWSVMRIEPGAVFGPYELREVIASGGMAVVHRGVRRGDAGFSRVVAIKRLHAHFASDPEFVSMLVDEARLASRIFHPNVVAPTDVVQVAGECFVVMDFVPGASLAAILRRPSAIPRIEVSVRLMVDVLDGLHAAHEARAEDGTALHIVHRDVSPQNILVGPDGIARLIDFGIAKAAHRWQTTQEGQVKGKLAYMASEQLLDRDVDSRTDVYSAAVVLFELLTGQRLFSAKSDAALLGKVLEAPIPSASSLRPDLPEALDAVLAAALSRTPEARPKTARAFAQALETAAPAATRGQVVAWLEEVGATRALGARSTASTERVSADEGGDGEQRGEGGAVTRTAVTSPEPEGAAACAPAFPERSGVSTRTFVTQASDPEPVQRRAAARILRARPLLGVGLLGLGLLAAGLLWALELRPPSGDVGAREAPSSAAAARPAGPSPPSDEAAATTGAARVPPVERALGAAELPAESSASAASAAPSPSEPRGTQLREDSQPATPHDTTRPRAPRSSKPAARPDTPVDCSVPYVTGADGIRRLRRECL